VTVITGRLDDATRRAALPATFDRTRPPALSGSRQRAAAAAADLVAALTVVFCIPFVILAVGIPIALCVRLLLWIGKLL